mgnify:CR=1 FL=1
MLQTIEVEIDAKGHIYPLEKLPIPKSGKTRAILTLLPAARRRVHSDGQQLEACGVLSACKSVTLDEMDAAIRSRGSRL